jgi:hypothetical protein
MLAIVVINLSRLNGLDQLIESKLNELSSYKQQGSLFLKTPAIKIHKCFEEIRYC